MPSQITLEAYRMFHVNSILLVPDCAQESSDLDLQNLKSVIKKTFRYCQAKTSKCRFVSNARIRELKRYKSRLTSILKERSEEAIELINANTDQLIQEHVDMHQEIGQNRDKALKLIQLALQSALGERKPTFGDLTKISNACEEQIAKYQLQSQKLMEKDQVLTKKVEKPFRELVRELKALNKKNS